MLRSLVTRILQAPALFRFPTLPPPPAYCLAGFPQFDNAEYEEEEESSDLLDVSQLQMAVPKRRVSHRRKRIKFFPKHLKPIESFATCKMCGEKHPKHYQLCPFCQPFNNFLRTKDHPAKEEDRLRREYELKKQEQILLSRLEEKKAQIVASEQVVDDDDDATKRTRKD